MGRGADIERELVRHLWEKGHPAVRLPGSGAGTDRELPDIVTKINKDDYLIELKYSSQGYCYITEKEWKDLKIVAEMWDDANPIVCARFSGDTSWYCIHLKGNQIEECLTSSNKISMKESEKENYWTLKELIENGKN